MEVEVSNPEVTNGEADLGGEKKDADIQSIQDLREHARQIEKAVVNKEPRFILRALRSLPNTRRKLNPIVLRGVIANFYTKNATERDALLQWVEEPMDTEGAAVALNNAQRSFFIPNKKKFCSVFHFLHSIKN